MENRVKYRGTGDPIVGRRGFSPSSRRHPTSTILALAASVLASACGDSMIRPEPADGGAGPGAPVLASSTAGAVDSLNPSGATLEVGSSVQLVAHAADGTVLSPRWTTSDASVASVSSSGLVTGRAPGTASVSARTRGKRVSARITVVEPAGSTPPPPAASCTTLESQSWWSPTLDVPLGQGSEHAHTRVCFPYQQTIDGSYTFTVESRLHHVSGWYLRHVRVQAGSDQDGNRTLANLSFTDRRCEAMDCTFTTDVTVDLSSLPAGEWEFRFHSEIRPSVDTVVANLATTGWLACVRSCEGRTPQAVPSGQTEARGWYRDEGGHERGYVNARFVDPLPLTPVSGAWCPHLRTRQGSGDEPVTHSFISVDPSFHAVPEDRGTVLLDAAGTFDGRLCIDTQGLANGWHRLFIRADWEEGPLAGALVVPFEVANP